MSVALTGGRIAMSEQVLIYSDGSGMQADRLADVVARAGFATSIQCEPTAALESLRSAPRTLVFDAATPEAEGLIARVRAEGSVAGCAVVAVVPRSDDAGFVEALGWGADEVVAIPSLENLGEIVSALRGHDPAARAPGRQGMVVIASPSAPERLRRARPLRNAGFDVLFAADRDELAEHAARTEIAFVVADADTLPGGPAQLRALGITRPVLVIASPSDAAGFDSAFRDHPSVRVLLRDAPPEDAIFLGNALAHPEFARRAAQPRVLHATVATFRAAGRGEARHGVTYNISGSGLYVRTLTPPEPGTTLWLEARPPFSTDLVHLECEVAWRRPFGPSAGASAPPGFGARITAATERCARAWQQGYERLLEHRHARPAAEVLRAHAGANAG